MSLSPINASRSSQFLGSKSLAGLICLGAMIAAPIASAQEAAVWTSATSGTLGGSSFSITGLESEELQPFDFVGTEFSIAPIVNSPALYYSASSSYTITFTPPVQNLRLYAYVWRGPTQERTYTFSGTPTILSGLNSAMLTGNTLVCPNTAYHSGILEFPGETQTLVVTGSGICCSAQVLTLGLGSQDCGLEDLFEDNDSCATATILSDGTHTGLNVSKADKDHYRFCVAGGATLNANSLFTHSEGNIDLFLRFQDDFSCGTGPGGTPLAASVGMLDNENLSWTNPSSSDVTVILEVQVLDIPTNPNCNTYDLVVTGSGCPAIQTFCSTNVNCTGVPTLLTGEFGVPFGSGLHLEAAQGPPNAFGFFLVSGAKTEPGVVVSNGTLCLGGGGTPFARYSVQGGDQNSLGQFTSDGALFVNLSGTATHSVGTGFDVPSAVPISGSNDPVIVAGSTWYFQLWHRDGCTVQGASNFSNGIKVRF